jgi:hypothetical protein
MNLIERVFKVAKHSTILQYKQAGRQPKPNPVRQAGVSARVRGVGRMTTKLRVAHYLQ